MAETTINNYPIADGVAVNSNTSFVKVTLETGVTLNLKPGLSFTHVGSPTPVNNVPISDKPSLNPSSAAAKSNKKAVSKKTAATPKSSPEETPIAQIAPPTNAERTEEIEYMIIDTPPRTKFTPNPMYVELFDPVVQNTVPFKVAGNDSYVAALRMQINPASHSANLAAIITRTQSMVGWIENHWGEDIDTITFQGSTGAFIDYDTLTGLTVKNRRETMTVKEFKNVMDVFRKNGLFYDPQGFVKNRYLVRLTYDYVSYLGYFESVDITEEDTNPFRFIYTITFKSEYTFFTQRLPTGGSYSGNE